MHLGGPKSSFGLGALRRAQAEELKVRSSSQELNSWTQCEELKVGELKLRSSMRRAQCEELKMRSSRLGAQVDEFNAKNTMLELEVMSEAQGEDWSSRQSWEPKFSCLAKDSSPKPLSLTVAKYGAPIWSTLKATKVNGMAMVVPINDVRHLRGSFGQAFVQHEIDHEIDPKKVKIWKQALRGAADISGPDLLNDVHKG
nr:toll/interleukin-1 receptor-like protein [Ipomoea trifida]